MVRIWILGAVIAITATVSGCGGDSDKAGGEESSETVVLTLANPDDGAFDLDEYARAVESESGGSLGIKFENNWRTGDAENELGAIEDVRAGKVDMGSIGARTFDLVGVDSLQPLVAPVRDRQLRAGARGAQQPARSRDAGRSRSRRCGADHPPSRCAAQPGRSLAPARRGLRLSRCDYRNPPFGAERTDFRGARRRDGRIPLQRRHLIRRRQGDPGRSRSPSTTCGDAAMHRT